MSSKNPSRNNKEIKQIIENQELENEELMTVNEDLIEENEELETEVKKFKKESRWLIISIFLVSVVLGSAIGYYYLQNTRAIQNLSETAKKAQQSEEKAQNEGKLKMEQELKLAQATKENQGLKDAAAKKAEEDALKELKTKEEADKAARKYVVANKKESVAPGLNTRTAPCETLIGSLRVWGTAGEVLEGPTKPGPCLDGNYEWYKVKWNDGVTGWSVVNYLDFTGEKQLSKTGYITGYVPVGYNYSTGKADFLPNICATNQADKIAYCNAEVNMEQQTYKMIVPEGEYVMTGKYKYQNYDTKRTEEMDLIYSLVQQCGNTFECYNKYPDNSGTRRNAKLKVTINEVLTGINLNTFYNNDGSPGSNIGAIL